MRDFDEDIFERGALLREFAHGPSPIRRQSKNFLAHIGAGLDAQRKDFPIAFARHCYVAHAADFFQFFHAIVLAYFRLESHAAGLTNPTEKIFRRVARFDPPL